MKTFHIFNILLILIFSIQSSWANTAAITVTSSMLEKVVAEYNNKSNSEKFELMKKHISALDPEDQKVFGEDWKNLSKEKFPTLHLRDGKISFAVERNSYEIEYKDTETMILNGEKVSFAKGQWQNSKDKITNMVQKKKFSFIDILIAPAYALVFLVVLAWTIIAAIAAAMISVPVVILRRDIKADHYTNEMIEQCSKLEIEVQNSVDHMTETEKNSIIVKSRQVQRSLREQRSVYCVEYIGETQSPYCAKIDKALNCFGSVDNLVSVKSDHVDNTSRSISGKDSGPKAHRGLETQGARAR